LHGHNLNMMRRIPDPELVCSRLKGTQQTLLRALVIDRQCHTTSILIGLWREIGIVRNPGMELENLGAA